MRSPLIIAVLALLLFAPLAAPAAAGDGAGVFNAANPSMVVVKPAATTRATDFAWIENKAAARGHAQTQTSAKSVNSSKACKCRCMASGCSPSPAAIDSETSNTLGQPTVGHAFSWRQDPKSKGLNTSFLDPPRTISL
ncbi:MAG: hypothetical protein AAFO73_03405 [Pseudomonadota bacterium]